MVPRKDHWWHPITDAAWHILWTIWQFLAYRKPRGDEGYSIPMVPRWRKR